MINTEQENADLHELIRLMERRIDVLKNQLSTSRKEVALLVSLLLEKDANALSAADKI